MSLKLVIFVSCVAAATAGVLQPIGYSGIPSPILPHIGGPLVRFQHPIDNGFGYYPGLGGHIVSPGAPIVNAPLPVARLAHISTPIAKTVVSEEYDPNPQYSFSYDVKDAITGDNKNQIETRNGDLVQGSYSLNDPDGTRRTVDYTAGPDGFNAIVRKEPLVAHAVTKIAAPLALAPASANILRTSPEIFIH